jgi:hypothetical protein
MKVNIEANIAALIFHALNCVIHRDRFTFAN